MEPAELPATLRLLAGLLLPCVALLCLLNGLLLLRRSPAWGWGRGRWRGRGPPSPPWQVLAEAAPGPRRPQPAAGLSGPGPCACRRPPPRGQPACGAAQRGAGAVASAASSSSSASDLEKRPMPVPPNSPAGSWAAAGVPDGACGRQHTSTQRKKAPSCRPTFPANLPPAPFEYSSSIQRGDRAAQLNSANFTASQGPGLDSDFGASAGVSVRILSDAEESPTAPLWHPQQSGRFEWDYYDPSYKSNTQLHRHLPCICAKQYWL